jgi:hypothetical protein
MAFSHPFEPPQGVTSGLHACLTSDAQRPTAHAPIARASRSDPGRRLDLRPPMPFAISHLRCTAYAMRSSAVSRSGFSVTTLTDSHPDVTPAACAVNPHPTATSAWLGRGHTLGGVRRSSAPGATHERRTPSTGRLTGPGRWTRFTSAWPALGIPLISVRRSVSTYSGTGGRPTFQPHGSFDKPTVNAHPLTDSVRGDVNSSRTPVFWVGKCCTATLVPFGIASITLRTTVSPPGPPS